MFRFKFFLSVLLIGFYACSASAQNTTFNVPTGGMILRAAPPGFFSGKGDAIGRLESGQSIQIIEMKSVPSLVGTQQWLKVFQSTSNPSLTGWVYSGK